MEDGNFRLNTRFLEHSSVASPPANQKKKSHKPCSPLPKCCLLFLGTSDDHPVRSPVWPLSTSSPRGANSFKLNCCYYKSELVSDVEHPNLDQVERDFCSARAGLYPCRAGRSYRRKRPPPQIPRSILSMKSLRGELLREAH